MRDLDLKSLRLLAAVCDHQNIKLAAAQEHIEPSAISKRIAQLEANLGTQLLVRGRRGVQPTAVGQTLLEHARAVLFTMERIQADVTAYGEGVFGHVRLVASASAVAESLLDDISAFLREPDHGGIRVDIEERLSTDVVRMVREGSASIGVCWDSVNQTGLSHRAYRTDELTLAVPIDHPLAKLKKVRFDQTLDYDHVGLPPATAVYSMLHRAAARAGRVLSYRIVVSNFDAALRVVTARLGISVIPRQVARMHEKQGQVAVVALSDAWAKRRFAILFREEASLAPAAKQMVDFLAGRATAGDSAART